jgi:hypothetical protein
MTTPVLGSVAAVTRVNFGGDTPSQPIGHVSITEAPGSGTVDPVASMSRESSKNRRFCTSMNAVEPSSVLANPMRDRGMSGGLGVTATPTRTAVHGGLNDWTFCGLGGHVSRPMNATSRAGAGGRSGWIGCRAGVGVTPGAGASNNADWTPGLLLNITTRPTPQFGNP